MKNNKLKIGNDVGSAEFNYQTKNYNMGIVYNYSKRSGEEDHSEGILRGINIYLENDYTNKELIALGPLLSKVIRREIKLTYWHPLGNTNPYISNDRDYKSVSFLGKFYDNADSGKIMLIFDFEYSDKDEISTIVNRLIEISK